MYKIGLKHYRLVTIIILLACSALNTKAQITLTGQIRPRAESRNGYGNLVPGNSKNADFISQRTRLIFGYKWDRLTVGASLQDVRVWGADASIISTTDNRLLLHEAWAELTLANKTEPRLILKTTNPCLVMAWGWIQLIRWS